VASGLAGTIGAGSGAGAGVGAAETGLEPGTRLGGRQSEMVVLAFGGVLSEAGGAGSVGGFGRGATGAFLGPARGLAYRPGGRPHGRRALVARCKALTKLLGPGLDVLGSGTAFTGTAGGVAFIKAGNPRMSSRMCSA
jgi:hypothetical protein